MRVQFDIRVSLCLDEIEEIDKYPMDADLEYIFEHILREKLKIVNIQIMEKLSDGKPLTLNNFFAPRNATIVPTDD